MAAHLNKIVLQNHTSYFYINRITHFIPYFQKNNSNQKLHFIVYKVHLVGPHRVFSLKKIFEYHKLLII